MNETLARVAITQSELFNGWPDEAIARLTQDSAVLVVEPGACLIRSGDAADYLFLVVSGSISLSRDMPSGGSSRQACNSQANFTAWGLSSPKGSTSILRSARTGRVSSDSGRPAARSGCCQRVPFVLIFAALERRYIQALNLHASAAVNSTQARIAALLKSIDARGVRGRSNAEIRLSQEEIAAMLGTRRQVVNRVLRDMAATGAIHVQYGRISILDREKLDRMAPEAQ